MTAEIATAVQEAVRAVGAVGMQVREARPPDLARAYELGTALFVADGGASLKRALQAAGTRDADIYPPLRASLAQARAIPAAELTRMIEELDLIRGRMLAFMDGFDAVVSPVNAVPAVLHGTAQERVYPGLSYTAPYNVAGWPAVVVRGGTSAEGLPIGVQVAARPWREDVALAVAKHLETALGGWRPPAL